MVLLTIGEVAKRSGIAPSALRFYEDRGLIQSVREPGARRRYFRGVLRRVAFIVFAQKLGLSLDQIAAELATLPADRAPARADWQRISTTWRAALRERIRELERLQDGLTECIGCGCLSLDKCRLANPGDRLGTSGTGPRLWLGARRER